MPFPCKIMKSDRLALIRGKKQVAKVEDVNRPDKRQVINIHNFSNRHQ